jgi:protein-tyrosine kinase
MNAHITTLKPALTAASSETPVDAPTAGGSPRTIGDILVAAGRLSPEGAMRVAQQQKVDKKPFGLTAVSLKLLRKEDVDFALSRQFHYAYLPQQDASVSAEVVAAYKPFSRAGENLRAVRSQLMLRWFNAAHHPRALAIISPDQGEGRSFVAANLAVVFAQQGERTLLIDGDLRAGRQHSLFKLGLNAGLSGLLAGRARLHDAAHAIVGLPGLAVLPCGAFPPNPQELLGRPGFAALLHEAALTYDLVIIDTPPAQRFSDAEIMASRAGAALMVARRNLSSVPHSAALMGRLQDSGAAAVVGAVLNDA